MTKLGPYGQNLMVLPPHDLKDILSQYIAKSCDFYSLAAEETIRGELSKWKGIGTKRAYTIYMRAVNGTYSGPSMPGPFAKLPD